MCIGCATAIRLQANNNCNTVQFANMRTCKCKIRMHTECKAKSDSKFLTLCWHYRQERRLLRLGSREAAGPEFDSNMQMQNQNAHRVQGKTCIGLGPRDPPSLISDGKGEHNRTTDAKNTNSPPHTKIFGIFFENEIPYRTTPRDENLPSAIEERMQSTGHTRGKACR